MTLNEFDQKMWATLIEPDTKMHISKDMLHNGLMAWGRDEIKTVGFGVSENLALYDLAIASNCDAIVVHHGISLPPTTLDRLTFNRLAALIKNDISLWSAHYTLDAHSVLGNNAQILKLIGATPTTRTTWEETKYGAPWGWIGEFNTPTTLDAILRTVTPHFSPKTVTYNFGPEQISKVAVISGAGGPSNQDILAMKETGIDLYITGEVREWHQEMAREATMNIIAGGHWHTETFGVKALQQEVNNWGLNTVWLDVQNPL